MLTKLRSKAEDFAHEWIGRKKSKTHIKKEFERHHKVAITACEYLGLFPFALSLYFLGEGKFYFHYFFVSLILLYISAWLPDFLYILGNVIKGEKKYVPTYKRNYSHGYVGIFSWTVIVGMISFSFIEIFWAILFTSLAFTGYWLHLATDKVELFVDRIAEFVENTFKEDRKK